MENGLLSHYGSAFDVGVDLRLDVIVRFARRTHFWDEHLISIEFLAAFLM